MAKRKNTLPDFLNHLTFTTFFNHYKNVCLNTFKWEELPEGIEERFIERALFDYGKVLFFRDPKMSFMALPCFNGTQLNVYGEPLSWRAQGLNYTKEYKLDECVLIENNKLRTPTRDVVTLYVQKMYQASRTMDVNLSTVKTPWIILCDEKKLLTYKEVLNKIDENEHAIFGASGLSMDAINVLKTQAEFIGNELMDFHRSIESQLLTYLGIDNCPVDKKERLITDEAKSNNELIAVNTNVMLEARERACEQINKLYGLNVSVKLRNEGVTADAAENPADGDNEDNA